MQRSALVDFSSDGAVARDHAGVTAAVLCAAHCALLPLGAGMLSAIGLGILLDERVERALLMLASVIGVWSLWPAFRRRHRRLLPLLLLIAGLLVMTSARVSTIVPASLEISVVVSGAAAVATAHLANLYWCRRCATCDEDYPAST